MDKIWKNHSALEQFRLLFYVSVLKSFLKNLENDLQLFQYVLRTRMGQCGMVYVRL